MYRCSEEGHWFFHNRRYLDPRDPNDLLCLQAKLDRAALLFPQFLGSDDDQIRLLDTLGSMASKWLSKLSQNGFQIPSHAVRPKYVSMLIAPSKDASKLSVSSSQGGDLASRLGTTSNPLQKQEPCWLQSLASNILPVLGKPMMRTRSRRPLTIGHRDFDAAVAFATATSCFARKVDGVDEAGLTIPQSCAKQPRGDESGARISVHASSADEGRQGETSWDDEGWYSTSLWSLKPGSPDTSTLELSLVLPDLGIAFPAASEEDPCTKDPYDIVAFDYEDSSDDPSEGG